jgi:ATPase family associated with various cellular activities (AAA)
MAIAMRPSAAGALLSAYLPRNMPVLLIGSPGVGKTSIVEQAANTLGYDLIVSHPVVADPTDAKGLPWPDPSTGTASFMPFGDLARALKAQKPTIWFLDDLGQASPAVQASYMQLLLARHIGEHHLPDCVTFVGATNRRSDRAGVSGLLTPVISRFAAVVGVDVSVDDWTTWALTHGVNPLLIAFIRFRPELLSVPAQKSDDVESFPTPRTWATVAKALSMNLPKELEFYAFAGAVGEAAATEFNAFLSMARSDLPNPDNVIADPFAAIIPERPDLMWALCSALAKKATATNCGRIHQYARRVFDAGKGEFAVLLVKDMNRLCPAIQHTAEWTALCVSPFGKSFLE